MKLFPGKTLAIIGLLIVAFALMACVSPSVPTPTSAVSGDCSHGRVWDDVKKDCVPPFAYPPGVYIREGLGVNLVLNNGKTRHYSFQGNGATPAGLYGDGQPFVSGTVIAVGTHKFSVAGEGDFSSGGIYTFRDGTSFLRLIPGNGELVADEVDPPLPVQGSVWLTVNTGAAKKQLGNNAGCISKVGVSSSYGRYSLPADGGEVEIVLPKQGGLSYRVTVDVVHQYKKTNGNVPGVILATASAELTDVRGDSLNIREFKMIVHPDELSRICSE